MSSNIKLFINDGSVEVNHDALPVRIIECTCIY